MVDMNVRYLVARNDASHRSWICYITLFERFNDTFYRKRETLINQIRDQATEIQRLMQLLENANQRISSAASPLSKHPSTIDVGCNFLKHKEGNNRADVQDWEAKAKESIEAFGDYIGVGTGSGPRNLIENTDSEQSDWVDDADYDSDDDCTSAMGGEDQDTHWDETQPAPLYSRSSPDDGGRRKETGNDKLATIPSQTAPFGLMANLSLRRTRMNRGASAETEDNDEVGVVRDDYFRAGQWVLQSI
jgi:hypothetical protein